MCAPEWFWAPLQRLGAARTIVRTMFASAAAATTPRAICAAAEVPTTGLVMTEAGGIAASAIAARAVDLTIVDAAGVPMILPVMSVADAVPMMGRVT